MPMRFSIVMLLLGCLSLPAQEAPWSTYRGNNRRTGNSDGQPGPKVPAILWSLKSEEHYVGSLVPSGTQIVASSLGALNRPSLAGFPLIAADPAKVRPDWTKAPPALKLPTVSSPAIVDGTMIFGDGMHQTDGSVLSCYPANGGPLLWQLSVPGTLVHMEGSPAVADGKVYIGGGSAGVFCVDLNTAIVDGKEYTLKEIPALQAAKLKELRAKYEIDKKKDPDFAIEPGEDQLLKPAPKVRWQVGKEAWHCDAPILVAGNRVLVASAYLDKEKVGARVLTCLDAASGKELWKMPTNFNAWGGPSLQGETVVLTTSTISYDPTALEGAKGEVIAFDLATGKEKWKKPIPGGVLGCAALTKDLAVFTATDGKLRAFQLADGSRAAIYDAKSPLFAPPAVVGDIAYIGDLKGVVHAVDLKTGSAVWTFDLAKELQLPGMHYGGVTVHGGKLYFGTCNFTGKQPTGLFCIGAK
jgi:outer membrane protein assembly factor BamB